MRYRALFLLIAFFFPGVLYAENSSSVYGYTYFYHVIEKSTLLKRLNSDKPILLDDLKSDSVIYGRCGTRNEFKCSINSTMNGLYSINIEVNENKFTVSVWDHKTNKKAGLVTTGGVVPEWLIYEGSNQKNPQIIEKLNTMTGDLVTVFYRHPVRR